MSNDGETEGGRAWVTRAGCSSLVEGFLHGGGGEIRGWMGVIGGL